MASPVDRVLKECAGLPDNQGPRALLEGQAAKGLKEHRERKAVGEKKDPAESLEPRGKLGLPVALVRMGRPGPQGRRERRVHKEPLESLERKENKDPRVPLGLPDLWAYRESLDLLEQRARQVPRGLLAPGARRETTEGVDHPDLPALRVFRAFQDREDRREKEARVVHRDHKVYLGRAVHQGQLELRETKVNLVTPEVMEDQEIRETKAQKAMQASQGHQAHRADLVMWEPRAKEAILAHRDPRDRVALQANPVQKDHWERLDPRDLRARQDHKVPREVQVQMGKMATQARQEQGVLPAPGVMTVPPVSRVSRESLVLEDLQDLMVTLVIRAKRDHPDPRVFQVPLDHRDQEETGDRLEKEGPPVPRVNKDRKDCREARDHVATLVQKARKDCKAHKEKKETRDGLVSSAPLELQDLLEIRVTQALLGRVDSLDPKATEARMGLMGLPDLLDRLGLGEDLVCREPKVIGDHKERGVNKDNRDHLGRRDRPQTSPRS